MLFLPLSMLMMPREMGNRTKVSLGPFKQEIKIQAHDGTRLAFNGLPRHRCPPRGSGWLKHSANYARLAAAQAKRRAMMSTFLFRRSVFTNSPAAICPANSNRSKSFGNTRSHAKAMKFRYCSPVCTV